MTSRPVVGEFVASSRGLGYMLMFAQRQHHADLMFALITRIMLFVLVLFALTVSRTNDSLVGWTVLDATPYRVPVAFDDVRKMGL